MVLAPEMLMAKWENLTLLICEKFHYGVRGAVTAVWSERETSTQMHIAKQTPTVSNRSQYLATVCSWAGWATNKVP